MIREADEIRTDEKIDFNANRSNVISGVRNIIQALIIPYVPLCGPLWAAVLTISGATWGLVVGIVIYIILFGNFKNPVAVEAKTEA